MAMNRVTSVALGEMGAFAARMVESGRYGSVSEVIRSGLRELESKEMARARWEAQAALVEEDEPTPSERLLLDELDAARARGEEETYFTMEEVDVHLAEVVFGCEE